MRSRPYYSVRTGKNPLGREIDLETLKELFSLIFVRFEEEGYFQEYLGYECIDSGFVPGLLGHRLAEVLLLELRKKDLAPIRTQIDGYSEEDLFDILEFLYDHCSKPKERSYHDYGECGWHCRTFDRDAGRTEYRERMNKILALYSTPHELSVDGELLATAEGGLSGLFEAPVLSPDPQNVTERVDAARTKFRRYRSSMDDRRDAIRDLADVLEFLRPRLKSVLTQKDEADLFNIANNFAIRHHNDAQKANYDKSIWYSWIFYFYLSTIHAAVRLIHRTEHPPRA